MSIKTCKQHSKDPVFIYAACAGCEIQRYRDQDKALKAENESLRKAMRDVMTQVDGNIRETVRDCVNGHNDVQDIYGYCDQIELIIDAAISSPENPS